MQSNKVRSRLKAQLTRFIAELSEGLSKPLRAFVGEMLFGIQASQDVKLSHNARSLEEEIPLIKTEDRLSRNLKAKELEEHLSQRLVSLGSRRWGHRCPGDEFPGLARQRGSAWQRVRR